MIGGYNKVAVTLGPVEMTMPNNFLSVPNDQEILLDSVDDGRSFIYSPVCGTCVDLILKYLSLE